LFRCDDATAKTIEEIGKKENTDIQKLNYNKCRFIFKNFDYTLYKKEYSVRFNNIDSVGLKLFLNNNKCKMSKKFWEDLEEYNINENFNNLHII
jgi:hypothetical protein